MTNIFPTDFIQKTTPAANDKILLADSADSDKLKYGLYSDFQWEPWDDWAPWAPWAPWTDWDDGNGIVSVTLISTVWKVKTYRILFTDTTTYDFDVTDWADWAGSWDMLLASIQSVTWLKTFDKDKIAMKGTSTWKTVISTANTSATDYTATLPAKDWTIAMTSDADMLLWTVQAVTAEKKFTNDKITLLGSSTGKSILHSANDWASDYTVTIPKKTFTIADAADIPTLPVKASWAELDTGTDDAKFATAKAIADSNIAFLSDITVTATSTNTLTNKRITARVWGWTTYTTDTGTSINGDTQDMFVVTAQAGALKFNNPSGTPTDWQKLIISVASSTTAARALTWDTAYWPTTVALPTTTAATTVTLTIWFIWSASKSLRQCVAVA